MIDTRDLLSTGQAARALGVAEGTVRSWIRSGRLPSARTALGALIDRRDIERIRRGRLDAAAQTASPGSPAAAGAEPSDTAATAVARP